MSRKVMHGSTAVIAILVVAIQGCGGNDCDPGSPDADAEVIEDVAVESDPIDDPATEADAPEDPRDDDVDGPDAPPLNCDAIVEHMTRERLLVHLEEFETIAADNDGTRTTGSPGWDASIDYVQARLEEYGYTPTRMDTTYSYYEENTDPVLRMITPTSHDYVFSEDNHTSMTGDFQRMHLSRPGTVSAAVTAVDLDLRPGNTSTSGCEVSDFASFPAGNIALVQRGTCQFITKALNAQTAAARAMIIFNQGNTTEREGLMLGGAGLTSVIPSDPEHGINIPILFATYAVGEGIDAALATDSVVMELQVSDVFEIRASENLLAEMTAGDPDDVFIYGAHLDTQLETPGINDNAGGVAVVLEIARLVAECDPVRRLRFGFWTSEEWARPWGSLQYIAELSDTDLANISAYINVDQIGSPNHALFVFDGDGSDFWVPGPPGSAEVERWFVADLLVHTHPTVPIFGLVSDHASFLMNGLAYGGIYTGGDMSGMGFDLKTDEETAIFGGTAGERYDPCQHKACDTIDNMDLDVAEIVAKSYARSAQFFGVDGHSVPPLP